LNTPPLIVEAIAVTELLPPPTIEEPLALTVLLLPPTIDELVPVELLRLPQEKLEFDAVDEKLDIDAPLSIVPPANSR
jgi:hypothetical protein